MHVRKDEQHRGEPGHNITRVKARKRRKQNGALDAHWTVKVRSLREMQLQRSHLPSLLSSLILTMTVLSDSHDDICGGLLDCMHGHAHMHPVSLLSETSNSVPFILRLSDKHWPPRTHLFTMAANSNSNSNSGVSIGWLYIERN